jgi:predicted alpha/beta superfamily hydrolase
VYVLDGDSLFPVLAAQHLFLNIDESLPEALIVGIAYGSFESALNKRGFDFSAPAADASDQWITRFSRAQSKRVGAVRGLGACS